MIQFTTVLLVVLIGHAFASAQTPTRVMSGYAATSGPHAVLWIARDAGLFEKNGIKVTANKYEAPPQIIESLIANRTDAAFGAAAGLTLLAESESPGSFKVFGLQGGSNQKHRISDRLIVRKGSPISGFKDMKGRSIATLPGIQWRLNQNWSLFGGWRFPLADPGTENSHRVQINCIWQF